MTAIAYRPALRIRLRVALCGFSDHLFDTPLKWLLGTAFASVCVALIIWNLFYRLDALENSLGLLSERSQLEVELAQLEIELNKLDASQLDKKVNAASTSVFPKLATLAQWLRARSEIAGQHSIDFRYTLGDSRFGPAPNVLEVPVHFKLGVTAKAGDSGYSRALAFLYDLLESNWRLHILSAAVKGDQKGPEQLELTAAVWVRDDLGVLQVKTPSENPAGGDLIDDQEFTQ